VPQPLRITQECKHSHNAPVLGIIWRQAKLHED
jgi:hypothetical protein